MHNAVDALRSRGCKVAVIRPRWWQRLTQQAEVKVIWPDMSSADIKCYVWQIDETLEAVARLRDRLGKA